MWKKLLLFILLSGTIFTVKAQEGANEYAPKKGDWMVSLNLGIGSYVGIDAPLPNLGSYKAITPASNWFDKNLSFAVEGKWMFSNKWAFRFSGGFAFDFSPEYSALPGTVTDPEHPEVGDVPDYSYVPESDRMQYAVTLGVDRYVATRYQKLFFRYGAEVTGTYGKNTAHADDEDYSGISVGEAYGFRVGGVTGFDYFFNEALFMSIEVSPVSYNYTVYNLRPQAGLGLLSSDTHKFAFLSNPTFKIGFRF